MFTSYRGGALIMGGSTLFQIWFFWPIILAQTDSEESSDSEGAVVFIVLVLLYLALMSVPKLVKNRIEKGTPTKRHTPASPLQYQPQMQPPATTPSILATPPKTKASKNIFISYSRKDTATVDRIVTELERAGHTVWIDRKGITGGSKWREKIVEAIERCDTFILILSNNATLSDNVRKELDLAESAKRQIIPVTLGVTDVPDTMKYQLVGVQYVDLSADFGAGMAHILSVLSSSAKTEKATTSPVISPPPIQAQPLTASIHYALPKTIFGGGQFLPVDGLEGETLIWKDITADKKEVHLTVPSSGFFSKGDLGQLTLTNQRLIFAPKRKNSLKEPYALPLNQIAQIEDESGKMGIWMVNGDKYMIEWRSFFSGESHRTLSRNLYEVIRISFKPFYD